MISKYLDFEVKENEQFFPIHRLNKYISIQAVIGIKQETVLKWDREDSLRKY